MTHQISQSITKTKKYVHLAMLSMLLMGTAYAASNLEADKDLSVDVVELDKIPQKNNKNKPDSKSDMSLDLDRELEALQQKKSSKNKRPESDERKIKDHETPQDKAPKKSDDLDAKGKKEDAGKAPKKSDDLDAKGKKEDAGKDKKEDAGKAPKKSDDLDAKGKKEDAGKDKKEDAGKAPKKSDDLDAKGKKEDQVKKTHHPVKSTAQGMTVQQVLAAAYEFNSEIREYRAKLRAADEQIAKANSGYHPTLTLEGQTQINSTIRSGTQKDLNSLIGSSAASSTDSKSANGGVRLRQNLFQGWNTQSAVSEAEANRKAVQHELIAKEQEIFMNVLTSYLKLLGYMAEEKLLLGSVEATRQNLIASQEKFKVGEETRTSVAQAESKLADFEAQLEAKRGQIEGEKGTFQRFTGLRPSALLKPARFSALPHNFEQAVDVAMGQNPSVLLKKYYAQTAEHTKERVSSGLYPRVDLDMSSIYSRTESKFKPKGVFPNGKSLDNNASHTAAVTVSIPLYEGGAVRADRRNAHELSEKARVEIETARRGITENLMSSWANFKAAQANMNFYGKQVAAQEVSLAGTREEMNVGTKILIDVLDEQTRLLTAQRNLVNAERDYYIAGYQLMTQMGILTAEHLNLKVEKYDPDAHYVEVKDSW